MWTSTAGYCPSYRISKSVFSYSVMYVCFCPLKASLFCQSPLTTYIGGKTSRFSAGKVILCLALKPEVDVAFSGLNMSLVGSSLSGGNCTILNISGTISSVWIQPNFSLHHLK